MNNNKTDICILYIDFNGINVKLDRIHAIRLFSLKKDMMLIDECLVKSNESAHLHHFAKIAKTLYLTLKHAFVLVASKDLSMAFLKRYFKALSFNFKEKIFDKDALEKSIEVQAPSDLQYWLKKNIQRKGLDLTIEQIENMLAAEPTCLFPHIIKTLPSTPGVYLFKNKSGKPLYIGKSKHIRKRVQSHVQARFIHPKTFKYVTQAADISYQETNGELGTLLLESQLVKKYRPLFNRKLRRQKQWLTWRLLTNMPGYIEIQIHPFEKIMSNSYGLFRNFKQAQMTLDHFYKQHKICLSPGQGQIPCLARQLSMCLGACEKIEPPKSYNKRIQKAIALYKQKKWPYNGAIAVHEPGHLSEIVWHVFNQWCYLGSAVNLESAKMLCSHPSALTDDMDATTIFKSFLPTLNSKDVVLL